MKLIFLATFVFLIISCSLKKETPENLLTASRSEYFQKKFLKKFKIISLPCSLTEADNRTAMLTTDLKSMDTLFTSSASLKYYGVLDDTTNFFTFVFYPYGSTSPILGTFKKKTENSFPYRLLILVAGEADLAIMTAMDL
jgi:hypothetical protein